MKNEETIRVERQPAQLGLQNPTSLGRRAKLQRGGNQAGFLHSAFFLLHFLFRGRGRQAMHLPCKQADVGALPTDSTSLRPLHSGGRRLPRRSPPGTQAGFIDQRATARQANLNCGKLDQGTERSLINFFRWV